MDEQSLPLLRGTGIHTSELTVTYACELRAAALREIQPLLATSASNSAVLPFVLSLHVDASWWIAQAHNGSVEQLIIVLLNECRRWLDLRTAAHCQRLNKREGQR